MSTLLLVGGRVVRPGHPEAPEVLLVGGRVTAVGVGLPRARARVVDLRGAVVVPGLADAHCHLVGLGATRLAADLRGAGSVEEAARRAAAHAATLPAGAWVEGAGWDQNAWQPAELPTNHALSAAVPDRPAALWRVDGHALLVNASALTLCGVAGAPEPADGLVVRDAGGAPTGVLVDGAMRLVTDRVPPPDPARLRAAVRDASLLAAAAGITCVHDMGLREPEIELLHAMERDGEISCRVHAYIAGEQPAWRQALAIRREAGPLLTVGGVKLYQDGALGSRGAALEQPYCDAPGCRGLALHEPDDLLDRARAADAAGHQLAIHAIGDRAFGQVLDALEALETGAPRDRRPRVEHAQVASPSLLSRAARLGAVLSMQPVHAVGDAPWAERRLGGDRLAWSYAWAQALGAGCRLALGTDFPVEGMDPLDTLRAATGQHPGFAPGPRALTREQALRGATEGPAWAIFREGDLGGLAPGMAADLTILDADPLAEPLAGARVLATVVAGRTVHAAPGSPLEP